MSTTTDHRIETSGSVSLALADGGVQGADVKSMTVSPNGLSRELLEDPTVPGKARYAVTRSHARRNPSKRSRQVDRSKQQSLQNERSPVLHPDGTV
ncbi:hypothetical protein [Streptomyces sp. NPDC050388]|uniref:hypothetical protein n=1 Tax=Streptomyces sp. NPDC050388 TaxID=3155781 RepID=UPI00342EACF9